MGSGSGYGYEAWDLRTPAEMLYFDYEKGRRFAHELIFHLPLNVSAGIYIN